MVCLAEHSCILEMNEHFEVTGYSVPYKKLYQVVDIIVYLHYNLNNICLAFQSQRQGDKISRYDCEFTYFSCWLCQYLISIF